MFEVVLGIDSSGDRGSVALSCNGSVVGERSTTEPNRHAESLLPLVQQLLADSGYAKQQLRAICVDIGPGSYTGLRVGIALATGMGLGLSIPVLGASSLTVLASGLRRKLMGTAAETAGETPLAFAALLDARRGESFFAAFDASLEPLSEPRVIGNDQLDAFIRNQLAGQRLVIAGAAAQSLAAQGLLDESYLVPVALRDEMTLLHPAARELALLANTDLVAQDPLPFYLRDADAKLPALPQNPLDRR